MNRTLIVVTSKYEVCNISNELFLGNTDSFVRVMEKQKRQLAWIVCSVQQRKFIQFFA